MFLLEFLWPLFLFYVFWQLFKKAYIAIHKREEAGDIALFSVSTLLVLWIAIQALSRAVN